MAKAIKLRDRPQESERRDKIKDKTRRAERLREEIDGFRDKTFESLSDKEKDDLLRVLAIKAGVLKE